MNWIDRGYEIISPKKALERKTARAKLKMLNTGYGNHGASTFKKSLMGWLAGGGSPKEDINDNLKLLRTRARDLYMGAAPIATGALKTMRTNVVGAGLRLKPHLDIDVLGMKEEDASRLEQQIEREFLLWSESKLCDAERRNNFYELQQLAFLSQLMSGEVFVLLPFIPKDQLPYGISIQLVEADYVASPMDHGTGNVISGIEVGKYGEPKAYYFLEKHPLSQDGVFFNSYKRIAAYGKETGLPNVIHLMESERPNQTRGVPILAPVMESLKQLGRYTEAELMAAVVSGMYTIFIESENPNSTDPLLGSAFPEDELLFEDDYNYELGNGAVVGLAPGDRVKEANPGRPNTAFDGFVVSICRQIGTALEIPYELLVKQFTSSYSASRAALLEAWKMFKMRRAWLASDFCQPIYEQWLYEAVASGRIAAPGFFDNPILKKAYCRCEWSGPTQGQIDPLKEVSAAIKRVEEGFSTRTKETIELTGGDFINNTRQLKKEKQMLEKGSESNESRIEGADCNE